MGSAQSQSSARPLVTLSPGLHLAAEADSGEIASVLLNNGMDFRCEAAGLVALMFMAIMFLTIILWN